MYHFCAPKFRFGLFVIENSKTPLYRNNNNNHSNQYNNHNNNNQSQNHLPVICHADTYEIKDDGSITFYQSILTNDNKRFKVPVLTYPHGKWDACVLLDDSNDFPIFKGHPASSKAPNPLTDNFSDDNANSGNDGNGSDELAQLQENFAASVDNKVYNTSTVQHQQHSTIQPFGQNTGSGMPGITNSHNPQEFKKQKDEFLENEIKRYSKDTNLFVISEFVSSMAKNQQFRQFKVIESDIIWASSKLIRNKSVMSRKFAEPNMQKSLSLILPDIMKRQWDGKMAPILQILQEREETKNITAIDLAVWMVQNNY